MPPASPQPGGFRLLLVTDAVGADRLLLRRLARSGLEPECRVVAGERQFRAALVSFAPDVILLDDEVRRFRERHVLRIVRRRDPLLPVIMVTARSDERRLLRLMRLGLTDFVFADGMQRLGVAVRHALERARERRRSHRDRAALAASERRFRAVAEGSADAVMIGDGRGTILYCNDAVRRLFGYEPGELVGRHGSILTGSGRTPDMSTFLDEVLPGRSSAERGPVELELVRRDGGRFVAELTFSTWNEAGERLFAIHVRDVSPRREAARQRTLLARAVEQARNAVLITDVDGTLRYVNAAFEEMTGYTRTEAVGRNPRMLKSGAHPASFYEDMWARLQAGETFHGEFTNRRKDGTEYRQRSLVFPIMDDDGATLSYVGIAEDVTRERRLEEQFRQAQKMEAVGQFAGGIAHDFNNVLTGILGNAELLVDAVADGEDRVHVRDIIAGAGRGAGLVRRLMALSREEAGERRSLSLAASVDEAVRTIRRMLPEHITVTVRHTHPPEALRCTLDDGALHQALMNLATNARDAMPRGGELELRTERVGQEAVVTVVDTGTGMTPEVVQRLFDPFFTTKERGKGTGLGMVMVLQFAEGHGGSVSVESEPGRGTAVELRIPVDAGSAPGEDSTTRESLAAPDGGAAAVRRTNGGGGRRRGTVVLAEDQEEVAQVARRALERMGLTVHLAADGARALEILRARRGEVDLVVSDLVMPHGGGVELYRAVADWPDAPRFLVTSGYAPKDMEGAQELLERVPFLPKPWRLSEFRGKVGELLEGC